MSLSNIAYVALSASGKADGLGCTDVLASFLCEPGSSRDMEKQGKGDWFPEFVLKAVLPKTVFYQGQSQGTRVCVCNKYHRLHEGLSLEYDQDSSLFLQDMH